MPKFPVMPIWGEKFFGDRHVMVMDATDIGAYFSLLWYAWQNEGLIPADDDTLQRIARVRLSDWARVWGKIKPCWTLKAMVFTGPRSG